MEIPWGPEGDPQGLSLSEFCSLIECGDSRGQGRLGATTTRPMQELLIRCLGPQARLDR